MRRFLLVLLVLPVVFLSVTLLAGEDPSPEELFKLGSTYEKEKTYKKAVDAYERFLKAAPEDPRAFDAEMGIARSLLGLNQWYQAVQRLTPVVAGTKEGTIERAQCLMLRGTTLAERSGGSEQVVAQLAEAAGIFEAAGDRAPRVACLFALARALTYSWDYQISYETWEKEHYRAPPAKIEMPWDQYQRERMVAADETRYDRVVTLYRLIIEVDGGAGRDSARARYMLGSFHVNVLAGAFRNSANYYEGLASGELGEDRQKLLERYLAEIDKGIGVWGEILAKNSTDSLADDAQYLIANTHQERRNDFAAAVVEYGKLLEEFPDTEWADTAKKALQDIKKEEIRLNVDRPFRPGEMIEIGLAARNVKLINFTAYRLDLAAMLRKDYRFHQIDKLNLGDQTPFATWKLDLVSTKDHAGVQLPVMLPFHSAGAFLIHAEGEKVTCRALVIISELGMVVKSAADSVLIYGADSVGGEPRPGVDYVIKATWRTGRTWSSKVFSGKSGEDGVAVVEMPGIGSRSSRIEVVGTTGDQVAVSQSRVSSRSGVEPFKVYTFTDRPVYRPNQTVHFKAIVRGQTRDGYRVAVSKPVKVEIQDAQGRKLFDKTLVTGPHGTLSGDLVLSEEPALGVWQIRTHVDGRQYYTSNWVGATFRVEEYKKPEFEVTVEAGDSRVKPGARVTAEIRGKYYFGAPVAHGDLHYTVYRQAYRHTMPVKRRFGWYYEDIYRRPSRHWGRELVTEGRGLLDEHGLLEIGFDARAYEDELDSKFMIEVSVTDASRREIKASATIFATKQPFFVQVEPQRTLMKPGDLVELSIKAEDANRKPVASEGKVLLEKRTDEEVTEDGEQKTIIVWHPVGTVPAVTREDGTGTASVVVDEEGQFRLVYVSGGEGEDEVRGETTVWVVTRDFTGSQYRFSGVSVLTDSDTYQPGDEIKVLINSHVEDAWILFTVEAGSSILHQRVIRAAGKSHLETLTVGEGWTPNVFLKALTIRDEAVFMNRREVIVPPARKFLDIRIEPAKSGTYLPGEEGEFTVITTGANGEPTPAELSLGFIDKSILYIAPDQTPDIRKSFYGTKRRDAVRLSSSFDFRSRGHEQPKPGAALVKYRTMRRPQFMNPWFYSFNGWRSDMRQQWSAAHGEAPQDGGPPTGRARKRRSGGRPGAPPAPQSLGGKKGNGAPEQSEGMDADSFGGDDKQGSEGGGQAVELKVRKYFPDTAFWNAHVDTGKDGRATVKVRFPDSLTTWQATAHGATDDTAVGAAAREFITTKNLILRLQAPRFFRERDELVVSGIVHNYFQEPLSVTVEIATEGGCLKLLDRGELSRPKLTFTVAPEGEQRVDWWFAVTRSGSVSIRATARSERENDAVTMTFPALEHGVEKFTAQSGSFTGVGGKPASGGAAEMSFRVPEDRNVDTANLTVVVNPTVAGVLLESLPYLADYPYGCVEQTMSRFLPTVVVKKTLTDLGFSLADLGVDPSRQVPAGYWGRLEVQKRKVLREEDLTKAIEQGLSRLKDFQRSDGAWGWWKQGSADLRMTAYVVRGLGLARQAGVEVDMNMLQRGAQFLFLALKNVDLKEGEMKGRAMNPNLLVSSAAAILEVATLKDEPRAMVEALISYTYEHRDQLGSTSRALLAISLMKLDREEEAGIVCENLTDHALLDRANGTCRIGRVSGHYFWYDDAVEATSESLRAYLLVKRKSELIPMMVKWLTANRRGGHWKSTKDTSHAVLALCDYLKVSKELTPELTVKITMDDNLVKTVRFTRENVFTADNTLTIKGVDLSTGDHVIRVVAEGKGNLYFTGQLTVFTREEDVKGAGNEILIDRKAYRIHQRKRDVVRKDWVRDHYEERTVQEVYEEKEPLVSGAKLAVGDEIEIELVLTAKNDYRYLVFEDMKGAGFEAVELLSGHAYGGILSYREFRDERVVFFCSRLAQGEHKLTYRLRAEIPGDYHVMPAQGQAMYLPEVRAISDELRLSITEPGVR